MLSVVILRVGVMFFPKKHWWKISDKNKIEINSQISVTKNRLGLNIFEK